MSEPCNTNSSPMLVNTSKIVSSFFITSSHLHCCVSNVCVEVSVVFALKEMAMIFLVLWTRISSSSPLSLPLSSSLLLPSSPFYVQVHVYSIIHNTGRYMCMCTCTFTYMWNTQLWGCCRRSGLNWGRNSHLVCRRSGLNWGRNSHLV